jgi:hypothetical protein
MSSAATYFKLPHVFEEKIYINNRHVDSLLKTAAFGGMQVQFNLDNLCL